MEGGMNCDEQTENCSEYVNLDNEHASNSNSSEHNVTDTLSTRGNFTNATELSTRFGSHDFEGNPWGFPSGFSFGSPFPIPQQTEFVQFETPVEDLKPLYLNSNVGNARNILPAFCGLIDPGLRIFGGSETSDGEIPWMVALIYDSPTGLRQECGGSLITDRHVLTAAHCISSLNKPEEWTLIFVRIGSRNIGFNQDCSRQNERPWVPKQKCAPEYVDIPIAKKIVHEDYEILIPRNDIAILVLSKSVTFTDTVRPICLPDSPRVSQKLTTAGWGRTETQAKSQALLKVEIPLANKQRCDAVYEKKGWRLISTQICAGGEPGKDSCLGDSGGPLMDIHNLELSTYCIVGVTSSGPRSCGSADFPAIYTKVYDFVPWILEKIQSTRNVVKSARLTSNKKRPRPQIQRKQGPQRQQQSQSVRDRSKPRQTGATIGGIDIRKQMTTNGLSKSLSASQINQEILKLIPDTCDGIREQLVGRQFPTLYISGGTPANRNEYPWMAGLIWNNGYYLWSWCAGSLITYRHVLTAGHCVTQLQKEETWNLTHVQLGNWDSRFDPDCFKESFDNSPWSSELPCAVRIPIDKIFVHEGFYVKGGATRNDIALLQLESIVTESNRVRPICLPDSAEILPRLYALGWGQTENRSSSVNLRVVDLPLFDYRRCKLHFRNLTFGQMCAGGEKGKDTCFGDSGGPLVQLNQFTTRQYELVGITAYGNPKCGVEGEPAVYTKVYDYLPWIYFAGIPDNPESCKTRSGELGFCQLREDCKNYPTNAHYNGKKSDEDIDDQKVCSVTHKICCPREEGLNNTSASHKSDPIVDGVFEPKRMNGSSSRSTRQTQWNIDPDDPRALLPLKCGLNSLGEKGYLFGVTKTDPGDYPWMAALVYEFPGGSSIGCGGSLITAQHVLTAAHCLNPGLPLGWELQSVRLGEWNISSEIDCHQGSCRPRHIDVPVVMKIKHESFNKNPNTKFSDDIALLKLGRTVEFTDQIQPICLPIKSDTPFEMKVVGWGITSNSTRSEVLLESVVDLAYDQQKCESFYRASGFTILSPTQICAGGSPRVNSCLGDSGGPLMEYNVDETAKMGEKTRQAIIGIVSFGIDRCSDEGDYGIYTKVYDYIPWILKKIRSSNDVSAGSDNSRSITDKDRGKSKVPATTGSSKKIIPTWALSYRGDRLTVR
ncbi:hypothetical protein QAD02_010138 [Eretmocerus hayati]|uniref:Uncharacterized protein n=1 Tax=Eretmocerus hayati TaxID=131215 RepID=A0ACC2NFW2_9HYME|nr:hypothetical protein QAD02_010138 [Eretmocerus hayati]